MAQGGGNAFHSFGFPEGFYLSSAVVKVLADGVQMSGGRRRR